MTYHVRWKQTAIEELGRLKRDDVDPARVHKAGDWIDYTLRRIPYDVGESRHKNYRIWYGDVLGVYYSVDESTQKVIVYAIGPAKRN